MPLHRSVFLKKLSHDHHHGLLIGLRARKAAATGDASVIASTWIETERRFAAELEPHFHVEERFILPGLVARGMTDFIRQLTDEHAELRAFVKPESERNASRLQRFGELLDAHIRFEERTLFEVVQTVFSEDELTALAVAATDTGSEPCSAH